MKITERIIGKAKLSSEEEKVARVFYKLPTAGKGTRKWVESNINPIKRSRLLESARDKIQKVLDGQRAEG